MTRSTVLRAAFAILAIAFFATPVALRGVGVTATAFENRRFAEAPSRSQGWDAFQQTTRFLTDRLPLREQAVRANNRLWQTFFGTAPRYGAQPADGALPFAGRPREAGSANGASPPGGQASQVLEGRDGWLFVKGELERACAPAVPIPFALARWRELVSVVRAAGKRAVLLVPPDKGSIYGEQLPDGEQTDCARRAKRRFWDLLARAPAGSGVTQLERPLARRKRRGAIPLYSKTDSHWTTFGSLELVRSVLDLVGGEARLRPREVIGLGERKYIGDLTVLRGEATRDSRPEHTIRRSPGAPRVRARTLFLNDSFGAVPLSLLKLYFRDLRAVPWVGSTGAQLAEAIAGADTVIFESVEREFAFRGSEGGPVSRDFLRRLRKRLGSH